MKNKELFKQAKIPKTPILSRTYAGETEDVHIHDTGAKKLCKATTKRQKKTAKTQKMTKKMQSKTKCKINSKACRATNKESKDHEETKARLRTVKQDSNI